MRSSLKRGPATAVRDSSPGTAVVRWRRIGAVLSGLIAIGIAVRFVLPPGNDVQPASRPHNERASEPGEDVGRGMEKAQALAAGTGATGTRYPAEFPQDLEVVGLIARGSAGMAIIAEAGGRQKVYRIGDAVRSGMVLQEVSRSGVTLGAGDRQQTLALKSTLIENKGQFAQSRSPRYADLPKTEKSSTHGLGSASSRGLLDLKSELPSQGPFVRNANDEFQLEHAKPGSFYSRLGLRPGDVLRTVNGNPVDSTGRVTEFYQQLRDGKQGEVEVLRQGRLERIRYGAN